jgi:hypothetical protein
MRFTTDEVTTLIRLRGLYSHMSQRRFAKRVATASLPITPDNDAIKAVGLNTRTIQSVYGKVRVLDAEIKATTAAA